MACVLKQVVLTAEHLPNRAPLAAFLAARRQPEQVYGDWRALMPLVRDNELERVVEITLFRIPKQISDSYREKQYRSLGLMPCCPLELASVIEQNPQLEVRSIYTFCDAFTVPLYVHFGRWKGTPLVDIAPISRDRDWNPSWYAGIPLAA